MKTWIGLLLLFSSQTSGQFPNFNLQNFGIQLPVIRRPNNVFRQPLRNTISRPIPAPRPVEPPKPISPSSSLTSGNSGNSGQFHTWNGRHYLLSWKQGRNRFTHDAARSYCQSQGMRIVSLDSRDKAVHFLNLVASENVPYFWAGGKISSDKRTLTWENGRFESIQRGSFPWSHAGLRGPQPDGSGGGEDCLAILNNVYNDAVKFHDVGCSHEKPVICE